MKNILSKILPSSWIESYRTFFSNTIIHNINYRPNLSQIGQDYWVINEVFYQKKNGFFLEIGSADGIYINNTYLLEKRYNWNGICIEVNPETFNKLQVNRKCTCLNVCIDDKEGEVDFAISGLFSGIIDQDTDNKNYEGKLIKIKTLPLIDILKKYNAPKIIDYFSIDVEGAETRILRNFPFDEYRFLSLTIERPKTEIQELLDKHGYILVKRVPGMDDFYIHKSIRGKYAHNVVNFYHRRFYNQPIVDFPEET